MRTLRSACLSIALTIAAMALPAALSVASDASQPTQRQHDFQVAVTLIERYREDVFDLQREVLEAPELALPETFDRTIQALRTMRDMTVHACFAEWWANEYISLKLAAMYTLYLQEGTTGQEKVDFTGWLADRLHRDAQAMRIDTYEDCA